MPKHILLISIKPEYANQIFSGHKTIELRRVRTKLKSEDLVIVYVTSPQKALVGLFEVEKVTIEENLKQEFKNFWRLIKNKACINYKTFKKYYKGASLGVAIFIKNPHKFSKPLKLNTLKNEVDNFNFYPPQNYHYLSNEYVRILESLLEEEIGKSLVINMNINN